MKNPGKNIVDNLTVGFQRVSEGGFVLLEDTKNVHAIVSESSSCQFHIGSTSFMPTGYAFALQDGSPMIDIFNKEYVT